MRSSQNFSQNVERFFIRSTLVLSVRGRVPPLLLADMPVAMLCSDAELFVMKLTASLPMPSDWDSERCIALGFCVTWPLGASQTASAGTHNLALFRFPLATERDGFFRPYTYSYTRSKVIVINFTNKLGARSHSFYYCDCNMCSDSVISFGYLLSIN